MPRTNSRHARLRRFPTRRSLPNYPHAKTIDISAVGGLAHTPGGKTFAKWGANMECQGASRTKRLGHTDNRRKGDAKGVRVFCQRDNAAFLRPVTASIAVWGQGVVVLIRFAWFLASHSDARPGVDEQAAADRCGLPPG
jgi:hypothetical protein